MGRLALNPTRNSLLLRVGGMIFAITVLAVVSMSVSWMVAETTQGSGKAINIAGSLRMQSWRLASLYQRLQREDRPEYRQALDEAIRHFEDDLRSPAILAVLPDDETTPLKQAYRDMTASWRAEIRSGLAKPPALDPGVLERIPAFVASINELVTRIEEATEARIRVLRVILGASVIATLLIVVLSVWLLNHILVLPLRGLLYMTDQIGQGHLDVRTGVTGDDEIGRLGQAFNLMAEDLSKLYRNLEARVAEKTAELTIANQSLSLLYHSIARLYGGGVAPETYAALLKDLEEVLGVGHGLACLVEAEGGRGQVIASTLEPARGDVDVCGLMSCEQCMQSRAPTVLALENGRRILSLPLQDSERHYGVLQLEMPPGKELAPWQRQLLDALSRHIGTAIGTERRIEQSRRLSLLEERAAIARELHDSLAQSLAYMKIQVSRLKPYVDGNGAEASEVLEELREGLNSAYRQLRELLTTFRMRIEGGGLGPALQNAVDEFASRGGIPITLEARLAGCTLSANEEIHTLQIVREALSNVINHAHASRAAVRVECLDDGAVAVVVEDDGIGIRKAAGTHHYGMKIMEERAKNLGGVLTVEALPAAGTRVALNFMPESRREARHALATRP